MSDTEEVVFNTDKTDLDQDVPTTKEDPEDIAADQDLDMNGEPEPDPIDETGSEPDGEPSVSAEPEPTTSSDIMSAVIITETNDDIARASSGEPITSTGSVTLGEVPETQQEVISEKEADNNPCPPPPAKRRTHHIDRLDQLCCRFISQHPTQTSLLDETPIEYLPAIISMIDTAEINIIEAGRRIHCDAFWRLMSSQWPLGDIRQHGGSHKRMFFEKLVQDRLESYHQSKRSDLNRHDLMAELEVARPYVHHVIFREQRSHLNLSSVLKGFFNLTRLDVRYGAYNLGMMYDVDEFGIRGNDVIGLNQLLTETRSLTTLMIRESLLNDELITVLCRGLSSNQTITYLDLSHNRISDEGVQKLAQVLALDSTVLISLNLSDNNLRSGAAVALAQALTSNSVLQQISLRLNEIGREGAVALFKVLEQNTGLISLNLSCNGIEHVNHELIDLMHANHTLQSIDLSGNDAVHDQYGPGLLEAIKSMSQLSDLDLRLNPGLSDQIDAEIRTLLSNRQERLDRARRLNYLNDRATL